MADKSILMYHRSNPSTDNEMHECHTVHPVASAAASAHFSTLVFNRFSSGALGARTAVRTEDTDGIMLVLSPVSLNITENMSNDITCKCPGRVPSNGVVDKILQGSQFTQLVYLYVT